jgi:hypothetical protein
MIQDPITKALVHEHYLDGMIRRLWWRKYDTMMIAEFLKVPEAFIANRLAKIRDEGRAAA